MKGSYLPGERPLLLCNYEDVSDAQDLAFFHNGIEVQLRDGYYIVNHCPPLVTPCKLTSLVVLGFADQFSGNYSCEVTSGSQVIASNIVSITTASKLFSALP